MPWIAKNADDQLGRVIQALKANGHWSSTLIVVLADHGATWAEKAHYGIRAGGGNLSWYYDPNSIVRQHHVRPTGCRSRNRRQQRGRPGAAQRDRKRRLQLSVHRHRDVADRPQLGQEGRGGRRP